MGKKVSHIAIILDGNRRYARKKGWIKYKGHEKGAETVGKLLEWCREFQIKELTLYCLSTENLKRSKKELDFLFKLFKKSFEELKNNQKIKESKVKIRFVGELSLLPEDLRKICKEIEQKTENYNNYKLNFCIAYGGRLELLTAINKIKSKKGKITEKDLQDNLWLSSSPHLIIRTGGRTRTSNFLPWQSVYSEWLFLKKLWPEFNKQDLKKAIQEFNKRKRNFGK